MLCYESIYYLIFLLCLFLFLTLDYILFLSSLLFSVFVYTILTYKYWNLSQLINTNLNALYSQVICLEVSRKTFITSNCFMPSLFPAKSYMSGKTSSSTHSSIQALEPVPFCSRVYIKYCTIKRAIKRVVSCRFRGLCKLPIPRFIFSAGYIQKFQYIRRCSLVPVVRDNRQILN